MFSPKDYDLNKAYRKEQEDRAEHGRLENEVRNEPNILAKLVQLFRRSRTEVFERIQDREQVEPVSQPQWKKEKVVG